MSSAIGPTTSEVTQGWVYLLGRYLVMRHAAIDLAEAGVDYNVLKHNPAVVVGTDSAAAPEAFSADRRQISRWR